MSLEVIENNEKIIVNINKEVFEGLNKWGKIFPITLFGIVFICIL